MSIFAILIGLVVLAGGVWLAVWGGRKLLAGL